MSRGAPANKVETDSPLLARVLEDARNVSDRAGRAYRELREQLLLKNKELFERWRLLTGGRSLIAYFSQFEHPQSAMQPSDIAPITALMDRGSEIENLDLLVHSPGGSAQTAEKIVAACREVCTGEFRVVVPNMAKSAATMTAICADQIVMGYLSELGPIDPQVPIRVGGAMRYVSAQSFLDGQRKTLEAIADAHAKSKPVIGLLQLLNAPEMSPAWISEMEREIAFGHDMVGKHLRRYMLPRLHPTDTATALARRASRIARDLSQADKRFSHGRMISAAECHDELGLNVEVLDRHEERWAVLWEIYVRMEIFMQTVAPPDADGPGPAKIFADSTEVQLTG